MEKLEFLYNGWQNRGLNAGYGDLGKPGNILGGKSGLASLLDWSTQNDLTIFFDSNIQLIEYEYLFDGFSRRSDACRQLDQDFAGQRLYEPDISEFGDVQYAVLPQRYGQAMQNLFSRSQNLGIHAVSLAGLGTYLPSSVGDCTRTQAKQSIVQALEATGELELAFTGANAYVLPYAAAVNEIPVTCSTFEGETYSVPFLQMVLSGFVSCSSEPINLSDNWDLLLLQCVESRSQNRNG